LKTNAPSNMLLVILKTYFGEEKQFVTLVNLVTYLNFTYAKLRLVKPPHFP